MVLLVGGAVFMAPKSVVLYDVYALVLSLAYILVCFIKGDKPRWRWGAGANRQSRSLADRLAELEELRRQQLVSESEYAARRQEILKES